MVARAIDTDLSSANGGLINAGEATTDWSESTAAAYDDFQAFALESNFYIQGAGMIAGQHTRNNSVRGSLLYDTATGNGAAATVDTDGAILVWMWFIAPSSLDTFAGATAGATNPPGGHFVLIGSSTGDIEAYTVSGSDFTPNPQGGWYCYAVDPSAFTADDSAGTFSGTINFIGGGVTAPEQNRGVSHFGIDTIRVGRCTIELTGGTGADTPIDFDYLATQLDDNTNRYGIFEETAGGYNWQGKVLIGDNTVTAAAGGNARFTDTNKNIFIRNTPRVGTNFHNIEIQNSSDATATEVNWTGCSFINTGVGNPVASTNSRGDLVVTNATANCNITSCNFVDMGTFEWGSGTTLSETAFRRTESVTQNSASIDECSFEETFAGSTASIISTSSTVGSITNCSFTRTGTVPAVSLSDTISTNTTIDWDGNTLTGYGTQTTGTNITSTTNGALSVTLASNAILTIRVVNQGTIPTVEINGTGTVNIEQNVGIIISVKDASGTAVNGAQVVVFNETTGATITNQLTNASGEFTSAVNASASVPIVLRVRKSTTGSTRYIPVETTANTGTNGVSVSVTLIEDELVEL